NFVPQLASYLDNDPSPVPSPRGRVQLASLSRRNVWSAPRLRYVPSPGRSIVCAPCRGCGATAGRGPSAAGPVSSLLGKRWRAQDFQTALVMPGERRLGEASESQISFGEAEIQLDGNPTASIAGQGLGV